MSLIYRSFFSFFVCVLVVLSFAVHFVIDVTILRFRKSRCADNYWLGALFLEWTFRLCGLKLIVKGLEYIPKSGPVIIVCNHQSILDILIHQMTCPRQITFIFKRELFKVPLLGHAMKIQQHIPVDRQNRKTAIETLTSLEPPLSRGLLMVFFAEGTRTSDGQLQPFKRGAFQLAVRTGATVVPCLIEGAFQILPKHRLLASPGEVCLQFAPPIAVVKLEEDDDEIRLAAKALQKQCEDDVVAMAGCPT